MPVAVKSPKLPLKNATAAPTSSGDIAEPPIELPDSVRCKLLVLGRKILAIAAYLPAAHLERFWIAHIARMQNVSNQKLRRPRAFACSRTGKTRAPPGKYLRWATVHQSASRLRKCSAGEARSASYRTRVKLSRLENSLTQWFIVPMIARMPNFRPPTFRSRTFA